MTDTNDYRIKLEQQVAQYREVENIHDLPGIFHYWAGRYLAPPMKALFGTTDPVELFAKTFAECASGVQPHFLSVGSGDCSIEVDIAQRLKAGGIEFRLECAELSSILLQRGREAAARAGVSELMVFSEVDINFWRAQRSYSAVMAHHSLHHIVNLERVFDEINAALVPDGMFVISDIIGRNGHMRWPEAQQIVEAIWDNLPDSRKFNHQLKRLEPAFVNWDCSGEGFEGIRAQDILRLLIERFDFREFMAFGNLTDVFVERSFGHNFDPDSPADREFVDRVHSVNELLIDLGVLKPTMVMATMRRRSRDNPPPTCYRGWSPAYCVRPVHSPDAGEPAWSARDNRLGQSQPGTTDQVAHLQVEITRLTDSLEHETRLRQHLAAELDAILTSTSWRVTAPLRWLKHRALRARRAAR